MIRTTTAGASIVGTGSAFPDEVVTTEDLCRAIGSDPEWVIRNIGPRERRRLAPNRSLAGLATEAGKEALSRTPYRPVDVSLVVVATSTPDKAAPSMASDVARRLGCFEAAAFDVNAVCSGFVYALAAAANLSSGVSLIIGADAYSRITDYSRRDCVFFGDGAGAVVLAPGGGGEILFAFGGRTDHVHGFEAPRHGTFTMRGRAVTAAALAAIGPFLEELVDGWLVYDANPNATEAPVLDALYVHQGSRTLQNAIAPTLPKHVRRPSNLELRANLAAATIPCLLDEDARAGRLNSGDLIALAAFGAGWTWGGAMFRWT